jgi:hypothetical protein
VVLRSDRRAANPVDSLSPSPPRVSGGVAQRRSTHAVDARLRLRSRSPMIRRPQAACPKAPITPKNALSLGGFEARAGGLGAPRGSRTRGSCLRHHHGTPGLAHRAVRATAHRFSRSSSAPNRAISCSASSRRCLRAALATSWSRSTSAASAPRVGPARTATRAGSRSAAPGRHRRSAAAREGPAERI